MIELYYGKDGSEKSSYTSLVTIGRDPVNDIYLSDKKISAFHAAIIENLEGNYFVRDLGSLYGIGVNKRSVYRKLLKEGDEIEICGNIIKIGKISQSSVIEASDNMEMPVLDIENDEMSTSFDETIHLQIQDSDMTGEVLSMITNLTRLNDFNSFSRHLLKEMCHTIVSAGAGFLAMFNDNKKLLIKHKEGVGDYNIPAVPKLLYQSVLRDNIPHFSMTAQGINVALSPVKTLNETIGLLYLYNIPDEKFNDFSKERLVLLTENETIRKHIGACYSTKDDIAVTETMDFHKWKTKFIGNRKTGSMQDVYHKIDHLSKSDRTILLLGSTGTGKSYLAEMVHKMSSRNEKRFVKVDLNSIPNGLIEAELFGSVKSAFTGASDRIGFFEHANNGTIFLDEIGDLSLEIQSKIRSVLDNKTFNKLGDPSKKISLDVRIIGATNRDMDEMVKDKTFRRDLYERFGGKFSSIKLVDLNDRKEDVPLLTSYFIDNSEYGGFVEGVTRNIIKTLMGYDWLGNIRALKNIVETAVEIAYLDGRKVLTMSDLPEEITGRRGKTSKKKNSAANNKFLTLEENEKEHIRQALDKCEWNKSKAADLLGIPRRTLYNKIKEHGLLS